MEGYEKCLNLYRRERAEVEGPTREIVDAICATYSDFEDLPQVVYGCTRQHWPASDFPSQAQLLQCIVEPTFDRLGLNSQLAPRVAFLASQLHLESKMPPTIDAQLKGIVDLICGSVGAIDGSVAGYELARIVYGSIKRKWHPIEFPSHAVVLHHIVLPTFDRLGIRDKHSRLACNVTEQVEQIYSAAIELDMLRNRYPGK